MLPMKDFFYGRSEPVWILNHERDDDEDEVEEEHDKSSDKEPEREEDSPSSNSNETETQQYSTPAYSPYYSYPTYSSYPYHPQPYYTGGHNSSDTHEKEREVVMKVPICCSECVDSIKGRLNRMVGVKYVQCDINREKVTVVISTAAPADVLLKCREEFKASRMWTDDD